MALSHAIMTALLDGKTTGYELTKRFDTSLGFFWKASHQQIYKVLKDLEKQALLASEHVQQEGKPDKILYELTALGQEELNQWVMGSTHHRESKDDLLVKLYNLSADNTLHLLEALSTRRETVEKKLALYRLIESRNYKNPSKLDLRHQGIFLALSAGISDCEHSLSWVKKCETLLSDL